MAPGAARARAGGSLRSRLSRGGRRMVTVVSGNLHMVTLAGPATGGLEPGVFPSPRARLCGRRLRLGWEARSRGRGGGGGDDGAGGTGDSAGTAGPAQHCPRLCPEGPLGVPGPQARGRRWGLGLDASSASHRGGDFGNLGEPRALGLGQRQCGSEVPPGTPGGWVGGPQGPQPSTSPPL